MFAFLSVLFSVLVFLLVISVVLFRNLGSTLVQPQAFWSNPIFDKPDSKPLYGAHAEQIYESYKVNTDIVSNGDNVDLQAPPKCILDYGYPKDKISLITLYSG